MNVDSTWALVWVLFASLPVAGCHPWEGTLRLTFLSKYLHIPEPFLSRKTFFVAVCCDFVEQFLGSE